MTLTEAISRFRKQNQDLRKPALANGECANVSLFFVRFIQENFVPGANSAKLVIYRPRSARHHPLKPRFLTTKEENRLKKRPIGGWTDHCVVRIGRLRIDWTARQFDPKSPFPLMWRTKT